MKLLNKITNIYLYFVLVVFILLMDNTGYYNILKVKWNIYVYTSVIYIVVILLIIAFKILNHSISIKEFKFNKVYAFALIYVFSLILSCLFSPYKNNNFLIGSFRMEGLIVNIIYVISFIVVALTYKFNKKIIYVVLIPSIIMGLIIIVQSLFFKSVMCGSDYCYSTIGNVDTVGLIYSMYITLAIMLFIFSKKINKIFIIISIIMSLIVMMIINVTSMYVTLFVIMLFILPYVCLKSTYLFNYLLVVFFITLSYMLYHLEYIYYILPIVIVVLLIMIYCYKRKYNIVSKKNIIIGYTLLPLLMLLMILGVYLINFKSGFLYEVHSILHGNLDDSFGTTRMFLWKRTIKMVDSRNILFGYGTDTFSIPFMNKYLGDLIKSGYVSIQDNACNIYLTRLINIGVVGLSSFTIFIGSIFMMIRKNKNTISTCILVTILSYLIQGLFNIEVVIVTPIFYILLSLYTSSLNSN